jgi:malate dehydrogenase (oxaloacetate-decarboxylating)(NADP+)
VVVSREVIKESQKQGLDREKSIRGLSDAKLDAWIKEKMYDPEALSNIERQSALRLFSGKSLL